jgi:phosphohistidine phosphatase
LTVELMLMRHAKSSWSQDGLTDHDRPLNNRGECAARTMAAYLAEHELRPDMTFCSSSVRTRMTLSALLDHWRDLAVQYSDALYLASTDAAIGVLSTARDAQRVLLIGHNPTMETLTFELMNPRAEHNGAARADVSTKFPTGALARLELQIASWSEIKPRCGRLLDFVKPRDIDD